MSRPDILKINFWKASFCCRVGIAEGNFSALFVDWFLFLFSIRNNDQLVFLAEHGTLEQVKRCVERGANVNAAIHGKTPLKRAIYRKNLEIVEYLIQQGANINCKVDIPPLLSAFCILQ